MKNWKVVSEFLKCVAVNSLMHNGLLLLLEFFEYFDLASKFYVMISVKSDYIFSVYGEKSTGLQQMCVLLHSYL